MEMVLVGLIGSLPGLLLGFWFGWRAGYKSAAKKIFKALRVPNGYRINSVGYEKIEE